MSEKQRKNVPTDKERAAMRLVSAVNRLTAEVEPDLGGVKRFSLESSDGTRISGMFSPEGSVFGGYNGDVTALNLSSASLPGGADAIRVDSNFGLRAPIGDDSEGMEAALTPEDIESLATSIDQAA